MKTFNIIESPVKEFIELAINKYGLDPATFLEHGHPQEDFLLMSKKHPIFVVADGVTLIQFLIEHKTYPNPSPAGEVARIFCEALIKAAEERYESFSESDLKEIFIIGNEAVKKYNQKQGREKGTIDYWHNDLYAATAAFAVLKDNIVYWGSICDSYISHFKNNQLYFKSPDCKVIVELANSKSPRDSNDRKAKAVYVWSTLRNGIDQNGKLVGYGVVTGEEAAERYLNSGRFKVNSGDLVAILTDGFEHYLGLPEFPAILTKGLDGEDDEVKKFTSLKSKEDLDKFGRERSLIAIQV